MTAAILKGSRVTTLRGQAGVGKSVMFSEIVARLRRPNWLLVTVRGDDRSPMATQKSIIEAAGQSFDPVHPPRNLLSHLKTERHLDGLVLALDDADCLSSNTFRYLGLLLELTKFNGLPVQLVLFGLPGRWTGLMEPDLAALEKDMVSAYVLLPLSRAEAAAYLDEKWTGDHPGARFGAAARRRILDEAQGVPARLDVLVRSALARRRKRPNDALLRYPAFMRPRALYAASAMGALALAVAAGLLLYQQSRPSLRSAPMQAEVAGLPAPERPTQPALDPPVASAPAAIAETNPPFTNSVQALPAPTPVVPFEPEVPLPTTPPLSLRDRHPNGRGPRRRLPRTHRCNLRVRPANHPASPS